DEKHGDQEVQGSEAARSGAYYVREHRTAEADAEIRWSTCFGVSADGS
ncbi:hypothetical protein HNR36_001872, partial [Ureibacillus thermosphaericus]|nr:hypothetical protein [Ureibacillus thermosphaericus]